MQVVPVNLKGDFADGTPHVQCDEEIGMGKRGACG